MAEFDGFDAVMVGTGLILTATAPTLLVALPLALVGLGLHHLRRSKGIAEWGDRITGDNRIAQTMMPLLLPGPKEDETTEFTLNQKKPLQIELVDDKRSKSNNRPRLVGSDDDLRNVPWRERVTGAHQALDTTIISGSAKKTTQANKPVKIDTIANMDKALSLMPKKLPFDHPKIPEAPTPTSVMVGYDPIGKQFIWADFGKYGGDTIHTFVAGQIGAGKDTVLRLWFTQLTSNNEPEDVQFIVIDAKGEWITPSLKDSRHMYVPPVGGFSLKIETDERTKRRKLVDEANIAIEDALIDTVNLLQERADEFQRVGATNIQAYERKTGKKMPLLFIVATDVGTNLEGILEQLIKFAVLKGRSFGVRAIISMQTASGEDTSWRGNMGMVMSGFQGQDSADKPNLGIPVRAMKYRPSELPNVDEISNRGLFVVRKGLDQYVVRVPFLPDDIFEEYCENVLPRKSVKNNRELLDSLLSWDETPLVAEQGRKPQVIIEPEPNDAVRIPKQILTAIQAKMVADLARQGVTTSKILTDHLKFTNSAKYAEAKPHVQAIVDVINRVKERTANR